MLQIAFPSVEIMLVFPAVKAPVVLLHNFGLLIEKLGLLVFHFSLPLVHELATANVAPPYALDLKGSSLFIVELPLNLEHTPTFLNYYCSCVFFVTEFLSLVQHREVLIDQIAVTALSFL